MDAIRLWVTGTAVLAAAGLAAASLVGSVDDPRLLAPDIAVGVVASLAVALLVRPRPGWPVAVALAGLAALSPAATPASTVATLRIARTHPFPTAVAVAAAGVAGHLLRYLWRPTSGLGFGWWALLVVVAHAALLGLGAYAQSRQELIHSLHERARRAEEEQARRVAEARLLERTQIAREMHDVLAHRLSLLAAYAGALEFRPDSSPERLTSAAGVVRASAHHALDELREVIGVLRAEPDAEPDRPQPTIADLPLLVEESRAAGVRVAFHDGLRVGEELPGSTARTVYRIVQEGLTNARKHAAGREVRVELCGGAGDDVVVEITNPFPDGPATAVPGSGTGLVGLAERVQLAGGRLEHGRAAGRFRLHAALPWPVRS
ncbi:sensor histidine kinase [Pseudonocardia nigra]|uniref:sensor histidine kinase n=1 Tax=Pseudonocardia nigra TaxID=1921578 RepID=UPI0027E3740A|nr:histidine kinase [Pseudonocardia nigra]